MTWINNQSLDPSTWKLEVLTCAVTTNQKARRIILLLIGVIKDRKALQDSLISNT